MAPDSSEELEQLRAALTETGYGELLEDPWLEAVDSGDSVRRLTDALLDAVVPAMRAEAAATRMLAALNQRDEVPPPSPPLSTRKANEGEEEGSRTTEETDFRLTLSIGRARELEDLAARLENAAGMLREEAVAD